MAHSKSRSKDGSPPLATNRAASHAYHLFDRFEAGLVLTGTEVKSIRAGRANLKEGYVKVESGEVFLHGAHVSPYDAGSRENPDPVRVRKLLLNAREIRKLAKETASAGVTIVPIKLYEKNGRIKLEIALARGKKAFDKREAIAKRDVEREMARARGARRG
jgi:SsrA-binding protein